MHESRSIRGARRARRALAVVGAVFGVALLSAGMASAADQVQLKSRLGGNWCFDAPNGNNTATVLNACDGSKSQLWVFNPAGQLESVAFPGQCIDISSAADDTPVTLAPCQTNTNDEHWTHQPNGQVTNALGPCLNVSGGTPRFGVPVIAYHCLDNVEDEQWDTVS